MKDKILYISTLIIALVIILVGSNIAKNDSEVAGQNFDSAKVLSIESREIVESDSEIFGDEVVIFFRALLTSGDKDGEEILGSQSLSSNNGFVKKEVEIGDKILVLSSELGEYNFVDYNRISTLVFLIILFFILIIAIGKFKGLSTLISLIFNCLIIFLIYIPGILKGFNIYILTTIICIFIITISSFLLSGFNKKTYCAIVGNISGILITGILAFIFNNLLMLTGILDSDYLLITQIDSNPIDLVALIWSGILIGSTGAIMDISLSISSSINELSVHLKDKKELFISGMNIGKDAIGTMTNTLILAYIGSALATVLLLSTYTKDVLYLFNMEMIIVEIIQAVIGSIGIIIAVPITTLVGTYLFIHEK